MFSHDKEKREKLVFNNEDRYNVRPPSDVSWFRFAPVTLVISTINHSEIGVINQLSYQTGATHCRYFKNETYRYFTMKTWYLTMNKL